MVLSLGTALILVAILSSCVLVMDREHRWSPFIALGAALFQGLLLFDLLDFLRYIWRIDFILPATQFIAAYTVWSETQKKRAVTASTVLLVVTMTELALLLGRVRP